MRMLCSICALFLLFDATSVRSQASARQGMIVFKSDGGGIIEIDLTNKMLRTPSRPLAALKDCGDRYQTCFTDGQTFGFSYFKHCEDARSLANYSRLKFDPLVVSSLHGNVWIVFGKYPQHMFQIAGEDGVVAIYGGGKVPRDFRDILGDDRFQLNSLDQEAFKKVSGHGGELAGCDFKGGISNQK